MHMNPRELLIETYPHIPPGRALEELASDDAERRLAGAAHSVAEIVAHVTFWQEWFADRCAGLATPLAASAADGWPAVAPGSWPSIHDRFLAGLERIAALKDHDRPVTPPIEFPPLAHYSVGDALVHIAQHNAHHLGQIILLRQMMGRWPPPSGSFTW
jgi:uncharacterized damage-inducible protein DinB